MQPRSTLAALLLPLGIALLATGCGSKSKSVPASVCASQEQWTGGNDGDELMHPGNDCIDCHASKGDAPKFAIAGTVFPDQKQADDCFGSSGVTVQITDASGKVLNLSSNDAGNFYTKESIAMPYSAKVIANGKERAMTAKQSTGACNSCHTQNGANDAPGRIAIPQLLAASPSSPGWRGLRARGLLTPRPAGSKTSPPRPPSPSSWGGGRLRGVSCRELSPPHDGGEGAGGRGFRPPARGMRTRGSGLEPQGA